MRLIHCACATPLLIDAAANLNLPAIPSRDDLRFLDEAAREALPFDPTPSLDEIAASPSVAHLGDPTFAPQQPEKRLRVIVSGSDAALSAVLARMMRADYLWAEVAYIPIDTSSPAAHVWGLSGLSPADLEAVAVEGPVNPSPCIRTDRSEVVAGSAVLSNFDASSEYVGEVVVDSNVLIYRTGDVASASFYGQFGAKLVPTRTAPGIAATRVVTALNARGASRRSPAELQRLADLPLGRFFTRRASVAPGLTDTTVMTGRAVQSGGINIRVTIDSVTRPRPVERVTFYRHLRDIQSVTLTETPPESDAPQAPHTT
ncbi:hypothetical protein [Corynebacterium mayonis]|uniref:hypothetical protein n=1 Tax=Corynebacterium mayonis TaxID=3062461 RepID=UPI0031401570